ncbi:MAG: amino acid permease, partial [Candidatus Babeliales bacterium]
MSTSSKKISLATATIVGMNAMIGAGIFAVPTALASNVGPAGILTFTFVIIAVWFMGSSMARLAQLFPQEGSFYIYAKQWSGHIGGLIAAGSYLVGLLIAMGLLTQEAGGNLHDYLPFFSAFTWSIITL